MSCSMYPKSGSRKRLRKGTYIPVAEAVAVQRRRYSRKQKIPGYVKQHQFIRSTVNNISPIGLLGSNNVAQGGFGNTGVYNMQFAFAMAALYIYRDGAFWQSMPLPGVTELASLYDEYRIDWVELNLMLNVNSAETASGNNGNLPVLFYVKDYDDVNALSVADMQQYPDVTGIPLGQKPTFKIRIKPRCLSSIKVEPNQTSSVYTISPYGDAKNNPFIDSSNMNVEHMGLKFAYFVPQNPSGTTSYGNLIVQAKYHITMRNPR